LRCAKLISYALKTVKSSRRLFFEKKGARNNYTLCFIKFKLKKGHLLHCMASTIVLEAQRRLPSRVFFDCAIVGAAISVAALLLQTSQWAWDFYQLCEHLVQTNPVCQSMFLAAIGFIGVYGAQWVQQLYATVIGRYAFLLPTPLILSFLTLFCLLQISIFAHNPQHGPQLLRRRGLYKREVSVWT
jgi:hypothetical protein